jgi:hypothetical protein
MRRLITLLALWVVAPSCQTTTFTKEVTVTRDATGKVVSTTVLERVSQPDGVAHPIVLEYIQLPRLDAPGTPPTVAELPAR